MGNDTRGLSKEHRKLVNHMCRKYGMTFERGKHPRLRAASGQIFPFAGTGSDVRGLKNFKSDLAKAGYPV